MIVYRPSRNYIEKYINLTSIQDSIPTPRNTPEEWHKDHSQFILRVILPSIQPPLRTWRIVAEAYLTYIKLEKSNEIFTFEQLLSDGTTVAPDVFYRWGNIKDPWAVGHDLTYVLHKHNLLDMYGNKWNLKSTHDAYKDGWIASNMPIVGRLYWTGLMVGGWVLWNKPFKNKPEPITKFIEYGG